MLAVADITAMEGGGGIGMVREKDGLVVDDIAESSMICLPNS